MTSLLTTWVLDLPTILFVSGTTTLYLLGARRPKRRVPPRPLRTAAFVGGMTVVLVSHLSAIAAWSEVMFWPHMVQHLLLTLVAAPLLAWSVPVSTVRHALPPAARRGLVSASRASHRARRAVGNPPVILLATFVHVATIWVWHTPPVYDAAVMYPAVHLLEHATFLASSVWFWSEVRTAASRSPRTQALATVCLGVMIAQGAVLGAVITFASRSLYTVYTGGGGLTALEDQQLAGALMWVPPGFMYGTFAVRRFLGWLNAGDPSATGMRPRPAEPTTTRPGGRGAVPAADPAGGPR